MVEALKPKIAQSLKRRIKLLKDGNFNVLVRAVCFIRSKLNYQNSPASVELFSKKLNKFMLVNAALRPL